MTDLDASLRFYRDLLGFREVSRLTAGGGAVATLLELREAQLTAVFLERDGTRIELLQLAAPSDHGVRERQAMDRPGLTHLSLRVSDLDAVLTRLRDAGARVVEATQISQPEHGIAAVFVLDPDATRVELYQAPGALDRPPGRAIS